MNEQEIIPKLANRRPNWQNNRDTNKFRRYHQHNCHDTEQCIPLKKIIEQLVKEGKLDRFIQRPQQAQATAPPQQINMINTNNGGPTMAGDTSYPRKQYVHAARYPQVLGIDSNRHAKLSNVQGEPITFYPEEEAGIVLPHNDLMIIRVEKAGFDVG